MLLTVPVAADKIFSRREIKIRDSNSSRSSACDPGGHPCGYSARAQTVTKTLTLFLRCHKSLYGLTGCPVVINTSFNVRGEPVVCSPEDAYRCFMSTNMDYLVLGKYLLPKARQPGRDTYKLETISRILD